LRKEKTRVQKTLDRKINAIEAINSFYNSLTVDHVDAVELVKTTKQLESVHAELDEKLLNLEEELRVLEQQIGDERRTLDNEAKGDNWRLRQLASITIAAEKDTDVEIVLVYGATLCHFTMASWINHFH
jgi:predicted  nucleic acid-binding Zn-ribbon protein